MIDPTDPWKKVGRYEMRHSDGEWYSVCRSAQVDAARASDAAALTFQRERADKLAAVVERQGAQLADTIDTLKETTAERDDLKRQLSSSERRYQTERHAHGCTLASRDRLHRDLQAMTAERDALKHEAALIKAATQRGITDCSTPLFQRVRNIMEALTQVEATLADVQSAYIRAANARNAMKVEIERLKAGKFTAEEIHGFCHDLHGTVDASAFAAGCAEEQRKLYGCAPDRDALDSMKAKVVMWKEAYDGTDHAQEHNGNGSPSAITWP